MNLMHLITGISLLLPIPFGVYLGRDFLGSDFPMLFGLVLQAIIGNLILFYAKGYEHKNLIKIFFGYFIFFMGLSGSYLAGKSFWLLFFWEVSTVGAVFIYFGGPLSVKAIRSLVALFIASSISMVFLCVWVFLPIGNTAGFYFLVAALLVKSAFSGLHYWLPEAHSGPPAHGSAAYSGLMINLPLLMFVRYTPTNLQSIPYIELLIFISGMGVFFGGIASFFHFDIKKSLAYSTVENSNFLWLNLLISRFWMNDPNPILHEIGVSFLFIFFITLMHHSLSKVYQFLSFGYISKIAGSTITDDCKGIGRISGLSLFSMSIGTLSFAMVPGTIGFLSESTFLFLCAKLIGETIPNSGMILPSLIFFITGLTLGAFAHIKLFLSLVLSVPRTTMEKQSAPNGVKFALNALGVLIIATPILLWIPFLFNNKFPIPLPEMLVQWTKHLLSISAFVGFFAILVFTTRLRHKIQKRELWDCGSGYRFHDVSIPGSVISDPLTQSIGRYLLTKEGESIIDSTLLKAVTRFLNAGKFWSGFFESGELSTYLFLSAISLLVSIAILLTYQSLVAI
jgi:formate hydrogenlyase subunit 3/multisubunit Na+/H+ antiporter MnhD subunit